MSNVQQFKYDNKIVRAFGVASFAWGLVAAPPAWALAREAPLPWAWFGRLGCRFGGKFVSEMRVYGWLSMPLS